MIVKNIWNALPDIFEVPSISNEEHSISNKKTSFQMEDLVLPSKNSVFQIKIFLLGFSCIEFKILGIPSEISEITSIASASVDSYAYAG